MLPPVCKIIKTAITCPTLEPIEDVVDNLILVVLLFGVILDGGETLYDNGESHVEENKHIHHHKKDKEDGRIRVASGHLLKLKPAQHHGKARLPSSDKCHKLVHVTQ